MREKYIELKLALELRRIETALKYLTKVNKKTNGESTPRGSVERSTVTRAYKQINQARKLYEQVIDKHVGVQDKNLRLPN